MEEQLFEEKEYVVLSHTLGEFETDLDWRKAHVNSTITTKNYEKEFLVTRTEGENIYGYYIN